MKRYWLITLVLCVVGVATVLVVRYWPRIVHPGQPSELYLRYEDNSHIHAAFIKDFRVNDSLTLDVTVLEALDSAGWEQLRVDFNRPQYPPEIEKKLAKQIPIVIKQVLRDDPGKGMDSTDLSKNDFLVIELNKRIYYLFHTDNESRKVQIMAKFTKDILNKTNHHE